MNNILSEKEYQRYIIERLVGEHGYVERKNFCFDAKFAMDREMLFKFFIKISGTLNFINAPQLMINLFSKKLSASESPPPQFSFLEV